MNANKSYVPIAIMKQRRKQFCERRYLDMGFKVYMNNKKTYIGVTHIYSLMY